ncbi:hypothetical protein [Nocardia sp. NBC_01327]|uniref:hypothetical protein n=1 Tax=Nocardia sp. NBC_01327 TaxID=2903593 RepID=UPI002E156138|nr:hypothetical protein OG326_33875 [Nocardia sp. NBC_01327]
MDPNMLRRSAQQAQQGARDEGLRISQGGVDPDYIQQLEDFAGFSHTEIYERVQAMDPGAMHAHAGVWVGIADNLSGAVNGLYTTVQGALADGMRGHTAAAADTAAREFVRWALDVTEIAHSTGHRILAAAYGAEAVRRSVPPPPIPPQSNSSDRLAPYIALMTGLPAPGDAHQYEAACKEQHQLALAALEANYVPTYPPAGSGVPAFGAGGAVGGETVSEAAPVANVSSLRHDSPRSNYAVAPVSQNSARHDGTVSSDSNENPDTAANSADSTLAGNPNQQSGQQSGGRTGDTNNTGAQSVQDQKPQPAYSDPDSPIRDTDLSTKPANIDDRALSPLTHIVPNRPGSPGYPGGSPTPGYPGGSPTPGGPGASYPAPPTSGTPSTPALSSTLTRPPGPQPAGISGMYPPAGRGASDADSTHRTPEWLIRNREQELLGAPPPTVPAVLGADFPAARTDLTHTDAPPELPILRRVDTPPT